MFAKHGDLFAELGVNVNNGLGDVYDKIKVGHRTKSRWTTGQNQCRSHDKIKVGYRTKSRWTTGHNQCRSQEKIKIDHKTKF